VLGTWCINCTVAEFDIPQGLSVRFMAVVFERKKLETRKRERKTRKNKEKNVLRE
jgi:hypothetical protein